MILDHRYPESMWGLVHFPACLYQPHTLAPNRGGDGTLGFASTLQRTMYLPFVIPEDWKEGTTIYPYVVWWPHDNTAGDVVWQIDHEIADVGATLPGGWTTVKTTATVSLNTMRTVYRTSLGSISMTGLHINAVILLNVSRMGADVADTYAGAYVWVAEVQMAYQRNTVGSRSLTAK
jgi:hypothetical protein